MGSNTDIQPLDSAETVLRFDALDTACDLVPGYLFEFSLLYPLSSFVTAADCNGELYRVHFALSRVQGSISDFILNLYDDGNRHKLDYFESIMSGNAGTGNSMHTVNATTLSLTMTTKNGKGRGDVLFIVHSNQQYKRVANESTDVMELLKCVAIALVV